ncbi:hypothetical protein KCU93_g10444, partial [Aureobasidium melanogenum]
MARLPGSTHSPGLGKIAPGLGDKGLGKSTAKRHRNVLRAGCSEALLDQGPSRDARTYARHSAAADVLDEEYEEMVSSAVHDHGMEVLSTTEGKAFMGNMGRAMLPTDVDQNLRMNMREMTGDTTKTAVVQESSRLYNKTRQAPDTGSGQGYGPGASFIPSSDLDNIDLRQERGNPVRLAAHRSEDAPVGHGPDHLLAVLKPSVEI